MTIKRIWRLLAMLLFGVTSTTVHAAENIWVTKSDQGIWQFDGTTWTQTNGAACFVTMGPDGQVIIINNQDMIYLRENNTWTQLCASARLRNISIGPNNKISGINSAGQLHDTTIDRARNCDYAYVASGYTQLSYCPDGSSWRLKGSVPYFWSAEGGEVQQGGGYLQIAGGPNRSLFGVGGDNNLYTCSAPNVSPTSVPNAQSGNFTYVTVTPDGTVYAIRAGKVVKRVGNDFQELLGQTGTAICVAAGNPTAAPAATAGVDLPFAELTAVTLKLSDGRFIQQGGEQMPPSLYDTSSWLAVGGTSYDATKMKFTIHKEDGKSWLIAPNGNTVAGIPADQPQDRYIPPNVVTATTTHFQAWERWSFEATGNPNEYRMRNPNTAKYLGLSGNTIRILADQAGALAITIVAAPADPLANIRAQAQATYDKEKNLTTCVFNDTWKSTSPGNMIVTFSVAANQGAKIDFCPGKTTPGNFYYSIILGFNNDPSVICIVHQGSQMVTKSVPGLLSGEATYKDFWITCKSGLIDIGSGTTPGQNSLFSWQDPSPLADGQYVGFWGETSSRAFFKNIAVTTPAPPEPVSALPDIIAVGAKITIRTPTGYVFARGTLGETTQGSYLSITGEVTPDDTKAQFEIVDVDRTANTFSFKSVFNTGIIENCANNHTYFKYGVQASPYPNGSWNKIALIATASPGQYKIMLPDPRAYWKVNVIGGQNNVTISKDSNKTAYAESSDATIFTIESAIDPLASIRAQAQATYDKEKNLTTCVFNDAWKSTSPGNMIVTFSVAATQGAKIDFYPSKVTPGNYYYSIILGFNNDPSVIGIVHQGSQMVTKSVPGLLSGEATYKDFWITCKSGLIDIGSGTTPGQNSLFSWQDPNPLTDGQYVGFWGENSPRAFFKNISVTTPAPPEPVSALPDLIAVSAKITIRTPTGYVFTRGTLGETTQGSYLSITGEMTPDDTKAQFEIITVDRTANTFSLKNLETNAIIENCANNHTYFKYGVQASPYPNGSWNKIALVATATPGQYKIMLPDPRAYWKVNVIGGQNNVTISKDSSKMAYAESSDATIFTIEKAPPTAQEARLAQAERDRLAQAEKDRLAQAEKDRLAQEQARLAQIEKDRLAQEQARLAQEEQARLAQAEKDRLAQIEQARLAQEQVRLAQEEQARLAQEQVRLAQEEQARLAQAEKDRLAREQTPVPVPVPAPAPTLVPAPTSSKKVTPARKKIQTKAGTARTTKGPSKSTGKSIKIDSKTPKGKISR